MVALVVPAVVAGQVAVSVVENEGDLLAVIQSLGGDIAAHSVVGIQILQHGGDVVNSQGIDVGGRGSGEGGVVQIQAGIQHGDLHAGAGVAQVLPHGGHAHHLTAGGGGGRNGAVLDRCGMVNGHHEDALDAVQHGDLLQILELGLDGEGVGQVGELVANVQLGAGQDLLLDLLDHLVLDGQQLGLAGGGDLGDGVKALHQGRLLHNDEGGDPLTGFDLLSGLLQLRNACGDLCLGQQIGIGLGNGGGDPLAFLCLLGFLLDGVVPQVQCALGSLHLGGDDGCVGLHGSAYQAVAAHLHGLCSGSDGSQKHAYRQQQRQHSFASHVCTSSVIFFGQA